MPALQRGEQEVSGLKDVRSEEKDARVPPVVVVKLAVDLDLLRLLGFAASDGRLDGSLLEKAPDSVGNERCQREGRGRRGRLDSDGSRRRDRSVMLLLQRGEHLLLLLLLLMLAVQRILLLLLLLADKRRQLETVEEPVEVTRLLLLLLLLVDRRRVMLSWLEAATDSRNGRPAGGRPSPAAVLVLDEAVLERLVVVVDAGKVAGVAAAVGKVVRGRLGERARVGRRKAAGPDRRGRRPVKRQPLLLLLELLELLTLGRVVADGKAAADRAGCDALAKLVLLLAEVGGRLVGRPAGRRMLLLLLLEVAGVVASEPLVSGGCCSPRGRVRVRSRVGCRPARVPAGRSGRVLVNHDEAGRKG